MDKVVLKLEHTSVNRWHTYKWTLFQWGTKFIANVIYAVFQQSGKTSSFICNYEGRYVLVHKQWNVSLTDHVTDNAMMRSIHRWNNFRLEDNNLLMSGISYFFNILSHERFWHLFLQEFMNGSNSSTCYSK